MEHPSDKAKKREARAFARHFPDVTAQARARLQAGEAPADVAAAEAVPVWLAQLWLERIEKRRKQAREHSARQARDLVASRNARKGAKNRAGFWGQQICAPRRVLINNTLEGIAQLQRRRETAQRVARILQNSGIKLEPQAAKSLESAARLEVPAFVTPEPEGGDDERENP